MSETEIIDSDDFHQIITFIVQNLPVERLAFVLKNPNLVPLSILLYEAKINFDKK